jgi:hypothetical protein
VTLPEATRDEVYRFATAGPGGVFLSQVVAARHMHEPARSWQKQKSIRPILGTQVHVMAGIAEVLALSGDADQAKYIIDCFKLFSETSPVSSSSGSVSNQDLIRFATSGYLRNLLRRSCLT